MTLTAVKQHQPARLLTVRQLMTIDQCAEFLGVTVGTIYVWISQRKIPVRKLGPHRNAAVRFDLDEIVAWTKGAGTPPRQP